jgi:hypothetical protein
MMNIVFPADAPRYRADNLTVVFPALVDGRQIDCAISVEALEDHFNVASIDESGWLAAFSASRDAIHTCARRHLLIDAHGVLLLRSGHFHALAPDAVR